MDYIHQINFNAKKVTGILLLIVTSWGISGCQNNEHKAPEPADNAPIAAHVMQPEPKQPAPQPLQASAGLTADASSLCQKELMALSKVNKRMYARKKNEFAQLLNSTSLYSSVRGEIAGQTQNTMDALYQYKTQKLCSDIEQSVRESLIQRGESLK